MDRLNSEFNPKDLEQKIYQMILCDYGKKFTKNIEVRYDGEMFSARIHLHDNRWCPLVISMLTDSENDFLEYVHKEIDLRVLTNIDFLKIKLTDGCKQS